MNPSNVQAKLPVPVSEDNPVTVPIIRWRRAAVLVAIFGSGLLIPACAAISILSIQPQAGAHPTMAPAASGAALSHMTSDQLATYVFQHHGCNNCHTMGGDGKFGFTDHGKVIGKNFEGCVSLLTSMNVIAQTRESDRSLHDKQEAAHFQQYGCTTCHQIVPGKLGLSVYGKRMKSLHMACTDVQRILSSN